MKTKDAKALRCNCCQRNLPADRFRFRKRKNDRGYMCEYREQPCKQCRGYVYPNQHKRRKKRYWERKTEEQKALNGKRAYVKRSKPRTFKGDTLFIECRICKHLLPRSAFRRLHKKDYMCWECHKAEQRKRSARKRIEDPEWHERSMAQLRQWKATHPERVRLHNRATKNKRLKRILENGIHDFTDEQWFHLLAHWDYTCAYCDKRGGTLEREHIIPLAKGGEDTLSNIVPSCGTCNRKKEKLGMRTWLNDEQRYEAILTTMGDAEYEARC